MARRSTAPDDFGFGRALTSTNSDSGQRIRRSRRSSDGASPSFHTCGPAPERGDAGDPVPCSLFPSEDQRDFFDPGCARPTPPVRVSAAPAQSETPPLLSLASIRSSVCAQRVGATSVDVLPPKDVARQWSGQERRSVVPPPHCAISSLSHAEAWDACAVLQVKGGSCCIARVCYVLGMS